MSERSPLLDARGRAMLKRLTEHPAAPRWNHGAGDRLTAPDLDALDMLREALTTRVMEAEPSPALRARVARWGATVPRLRGVDLSEWSRIPTMAREDVATAIHTLIPDDAPLERLIVYRTAGVTGHALLVPHDARAVAGYLPLLEVALAAHGVPWDIDGDTVGAFLVGAQARTVTLATVLHGWGGCGWAKLNLRPTEWPTAPHRYFSDLAPRLLTGDPLSFGELLRMDIPATPRALVSTAVAMSAGLRRKLSAHYGAPVIDWYSLTETGPIGFRCPLGDAYHVVPHDLFVEILAPPGERGEIVVSGGRNPFLPLVRYRTGDFGRLDFAPCPCGDPMPRIVELEGRAPVRLRAHDGSAVNPVDLSRVLRELPLVQHTLVQHADGSVTVVVRPLAGAILHPDDVRGAVVAVMGEVGVEVRVDPTLGDRAGKVVPYVSELLEE